MAPGWNLGDLVSRILGGGGSSADKDAAPDAGGSEIAGDLSTPEDASVSPLALMNEKSPEAWLGNFLTIIGAPPALQPSSIQSASRDERLRSHLTGIVEETRESDPLRMLEPGYAEQLKAQDWATWWKAEDAVARYCYAALSLAILSDHSYVSDIGVMYRQQVNTRIHKDAHYVLTYMLGKDWPSYMPTDFDLKRLGA
jgi:hypothetical protein